MSTYVSQRNHRKLTVSTGNIRSLERYDRYYDFTCDLAERGLLPVEWPVGANVFCKASAAFDVERARTIPPMEHSGLSLNNRYSGRRLDGISGEGALYVASLPGLIREHAHYATRRDPEPLGSSPRTLGLARPGGVDATRAFLEKELSTKSAGSALFHVYTLQRPLRLVDLRVRCLFRLFSTYLADADSRKRYGISMDTPTDFLSSAVTSPSDYSASRGVADAVSDARRRMFVDGICATTSRGESDSGLVLGLAGEASGAIQVLFGTPRTKIEALKPRDTFASINQLISSIRA